MAAPRAMRQTRPFQTMQELGDTLLDYGATGYANSDDPLDIAGHAYLSGVRPSRRIEEQADAELGRLYEAWKRNHGKPGMFWKKSDGPRIWRAFITMARLLDFDPSRRRDPR